jgi:HAD superfamily hydrolase (TIGR01484 family)
MLDHPTRFLALATDYDGTIAHNGYVDEETVAALRRFVESGRKLILVTGRELQELLAIFPHARLFDWIVAENGALLYRPETGEEKLLGKPPPSDFLRLIKERRVNPVSIGKVIVATWEPHEKTILETIRELGLELQVIFNKGAVMVLPAGVNKATGLGAALKEMGLSPHNVVGVGDAENDHAMMSFCECSAAVANALPKVRERADIALEKDHGAGVTELIDMMIEDDLKQYESRLNRYHTHIGKTQDGKSVRIPPHGINVLITGSSGAGKSTLTTGILERLFDLSYQYCIIDPEGDYDTFEHAVPIGNRKHAPSEDEVVRLLKNMDGNVTVNMVGMPLQDRPGFFLKLLPKLLELRHETARPHWLIVDEAHHMLPGPWDLHTVPYFEFLTNMLYVTLLPNALPPTVLQTIDVVIAVGEQPENTIANFCEIIGVDMPPMQPTLLARGEVVVWNRKTGEPPVKVITPRNRTERRRHVRKYAEGELSHERSFYFRGPEDKLNIRAQNLILFMQLADGIDDDTWMYHLKHHDYSQWFRMQIKDEDLADEAEMIENKEDISPEESRKLIRAVIEQHYTLPEPPPPSKNSRPAMAMNSKKR